MNSGRRRVAASFAALMWIAPGLFAQEPVAKPKSSLEAMQLATEKQRKSVRRQVSTPDVPTNGFFSLQWTGPATLSPPTAGLVGEADCDAMAAADLDALVRKSATDEGVNPALIRAVIQRESAGRPCAVSVKGAQGIMQLMPATQADLGVTNPFDAAANIAGGTRYLKQLLGKYEGKTAFALAAYNAGPARVDPKTGATGIAETEQYVNDILSRLGNAEP